MDMTASIHRHSPFFFAAFIPFAIVAFGYNFFVGDLSRFVTVHHLHGVAMFAWLILLVAQASLIRMGSRALHAKLGKSSYALAPFIAVTTIVLAHHMFGTRAPEGRILLALQLFMLLQFLIIYCNAIRYRKSPDIHARWIVGTIMPMIDPIFNRLMGYFLSLDIPAVVITFAATDMLIAGLMIWDWKVHGRKDVFLPMLAICLATQLPVLALTAASPWQDAWVIFSNWFLGLPLS
jgi:hypothetical protein